MLQRETIHFESAAAVPGHVMVEVRRGGATVLAWASLVDVGEEARLAFSMGGQPPVTTSDGSRLLGKRLAVHLPQSRPRAT